MRCVQGSALMYFLGYGLKTEATVPDLVKILHFTYFLTVTLCLSTSVLAVHFIGHHRSQSNFKIILQLFSAFCFGLTITSVVIYKFSIFSMSQSLQFIDQNGLYPNCQT